jgi:TetR/AcrR family acrAB operon transcriptional repressor
MPKPKIASVHGRQTEQGQVSRKALIDAAVALICERGIHGTSVGAICERAGVVKTSLYWHFGSKDGLLAAVMDDIASLWVDEILNVVYRVGNPRARLDALIAGLRVVVEKRAQLLQVIQAVISESANVSDEVRDAVRRLNTLSLDAIAQGYRDTLGMDLPDLDLLANTIIALTHGALRQYQIDPENTDLDRLFEDMKRTAVVILNERIRRTLGKDVLDTGENT